MAMTVSICGENLEPIGSYPEDFDIEINEDGDFGPIELRARALAAAGTKCCIRWYRPSDGQVAYWGPRGATRRPYWYRAMKFLIWSQKEKAWWRPDGGGYTKQKAEAGRYDFSEIERHTLDGVEGDVPRRADMLVREW